MKWAKKFTKMGLLVVLSIVLSAFFRTSKPVLTEHNSDGLPGFVGEFIFTNAGDSNIQRLSVLDVTEGLIFKDYKYLATFPNGPMTTRIKKIESDLYILQSKPLNEEYWNYFYLSLTDQGLRIYIPDSRVGATYLSNKAASSNVTAELNQDSSIKSTFFLGGNSEDILQFLEQLPGQIELVNVFTATRISGTPKTFFAADPRDQIIGKWRAVKSSDTFEFMDDGTVIIGTVAGQYEFIDDNRMKLILGGFAGTKVVTVSIDSDALFLTDGNRRPEEFRRFR